MKRIISFLLVFVSLFLLIGCKEKEKTPSIEITNKISTLKVDEEKKLTIKVLNAKEDVEWVSSDSTIVSVDNGTVKGVSKGEATITVTLKENKEIKDSVKITVEENGEEILEPKLTLETKELELYVNETKEIKVKVENSDKKASFASKDESIATVDASGLVKGIAAGEAIIEVTLEGTELKAECKVTVKANEVTISGATEVVAGSQIELKASLNGEETKAEWNSEEVKVATVNQEGVVTGVSEGSVVITAKINGTVAKVTIIVKSNTTKPTSIEVTKEDGVIYATDTVKLNVTVLPLGASSEVKYKISNDSIATIDNAGNVRFKKGGEVVVTVTSKLTSAVKTNITLTALEYIDPVKFFTESNVGTVSQQYVTLYSGAFSVPKVTLLSGTVSYYYFEDFKVDTTYAYDDPNTKISYGKRKVTWFITVHDSAAGKDSNGTGYALAVYAKQMADTGSEDKSWHYSVGSDGIFKGLNEDLGGWHAGDGKREATWTDTGIPANGADWAEVTISDDGYWELNGIKSNLLAPEVPIQHYAGGWQTTGTRRARTSDLPSTGIATRVGSKGTFLINSVWWSQSYQTLSNYGGNVNSVGMETAIDEDVNLEVCWHNIAKLCADIIVRRNLALGLRAICQHNTFSGKDCPQTMRTAGRWEYFMKMAEAEYKVRKYLNDFKIEFICDSDLVNEKGQVIKFPETDTLVDYSVRITSEKYGYDQTVNLQTKVPAYLGDLKN